jgi:prophage antirepressor-like protein
MSLDLSLTWSGHRVRMVGTREAPEWIAADVCAALELRSNNPWKHLPASERGKHMALTPGGWQKVVTVTESGLYRLIFAARIPSAEAFRTWIVREVLPSIRKHGCYPAPSGPRSLAVDLRDPKQLAALTLQLTEIVAEKDQVIAELTPKAESHDRLSAARGEVCLQDAARILGRRPNLFIKTLLADGVLFRGSHGCPEPYRPYLQAGYFRVRAVPVGEEGEDDKVRTQTLVTGPGLQWLATRYPAEVVTNAIARVVPQEVHL